MLRHAAKLCDWPRLRCNAGTSGSSSESELWPFSLSTPLSPASLISASTYAFIAMTRRMMRIESDWSRRRISASESTCLVVL